VDLVGSLFGKVIVAFFYVFFYVMFFFIFTGSPDWEKYQGMRSIAVVFFLFVDGMKRFVYLSLGIWTDTTVRAYNIIGRAERYKPDPNKDAKVKKKVSTLSIFFHRHFPRAESFVSGGAKKLQRDPSSSKLGGGGGVTPGKQNQQKVDSLHETTMYLTATSRTVALVPIPLLLILAKFSESLNQALIFLWVRHEKIQLRTPFYLRFITWISQIAQMPLVLAVVLTASEYLVSAACLTFVPIFFSRVLSEVVQLFSTVNEDIEEIAEEITSSAQYAEQAISADLADVALD